MCARLQAMLHAPLLRQYFLAEGHQAGSCHRAACTQPCLSCELVRPPQDTQLSSLPLITAVTAHQSCKLS